MSTEPVNQTNSEPPPLRMVVFSRSEAIPGISSPGDKLNPLDYAVARTLERITAPAFMIGPHDLFWNWKLASELGRVIPVRDEHAMKSMVTERLGSLLPSNLWVVEIVNGDNLPSDQMLMAFFPWLRSQPHDVVFAETVRPYIRPAKRLIRMAPGEPEEVIMEADAGGPLYEASNIIKAVRLSSMSEGTTGRTAYFAH